jgi:hypothetical protein
MTFHRQIAFHDHIQEYVKMNLCLHCGARRVDRETIERANTPAGTRTWVPVPHHRVLEEVERAMAGGGLRVVNEAHALWGIGQRYFGLLEVCNGHPHGDNSLVIGVRNSHDQTFPASIALGSTVFVFDNLSFSGEVTIARRHTRFIERDLPVPRHLSRR